MNPLKETNFSFPGQTGFYRGKVRDVYEFPDSLLMVTSDRISAFDVVLPRGIPYKGEVLNRTAAHFLKATAQAVPNWLLATPDANVAVGLRCTPFAVEMVIRGYLAGHAAREYAAGKRSICGVSLPEGLKENDRLPEPIITPTTKAAAGHDLDISREEILSQGIVPEEKYLEMERYTRSLYNIGTQMAAERGLILVDTKYEFGEHESKTYLIDEVHTPDSSRYFIADGYEERQQNAEPQKQLSKEFVRQWLIANGFQGKEGQTVPEMSNEWVQQISARYIELFELVTGTPFRESNAPDSNSTDSDIARRVEQNILKYLADSKTGKANGRP
ncbi:MAG: phosphoribosylaminoimidazolesuccinocarboxamide synthase [Bacteroidota bacterium]